MSAISTGQNARYIPILDVWKSWGTRVSLGQSGDMHDVHMLH